MDYKIDVEGIEETLTILRKAEPALLNKLRSEIKNEPGLQNAMAGIRSAIPSVSPLQGNQFGYGGMNHNGRTSYKGATVKPLVNTSTSYKQFGRGYSRLVTISTAPPSDGVGFQILDMVGRGKNANTAKARGMKSKLVGSASRYVWKGFEAKEEGVAVAVRSIVEKYAAIVNVKLR